MNIIKSKKILTPIVLFLSTALFAYLAFIFCELDKIPVRQTKDYNTITVNNNLYLADYKIFLDVPSEYEALEQINYATRVQIASYMRKNDFILRNGTHEFNRTANDFDELVYENFKFVVQKSTPPV